MPLSEIPGFDFGRDWIAKLLKKLSTIRAERAAELNRIADVFGDPVSLSRYYIEPDCQQFNPADMEDEGATVVRAPIFRQLRAFIAKEVPNGTRVLLILSDAGMGKTSVLVMLKLTHLMSFWPQSHRCEILKLGEDSIEAINKLPDKRSTVLLLDALDEDPLAWDRVHERMQDILEATRSFRKVIMTCRVQFLRAGEDLFMRHGQKTFGTHSCAVIYSSLLSDEQVADYLARRSREQPDPADWLKRAWGVVERIGYLSMRPMLLTHMDSILESEDVVWDEYSLYEALVTVWLNRERAKPSARPVEYPAVQEMFHACQWLALQLSKKRASYISNDSLHIAVKNLAPLQSVLRSDLGGRSLLTRNTEGGFRFSHFSIQEFLVASYMLESGGQDESFRDVVVTDFMSGLAEAWIKRNAPAVLTRDAWRYFSFRGRSLDGVTFEGIDFSGSTALDGGSFQSCVFKHCVFAGIGFKDARFLNCRFEACRFKQIDITACAFVETVFRGCELLGIHLVKVSMVGSHIEDCKIANLVHGAVEIDPRKLGSTLLNQLPSLLSELLSNDRLDGEVLRLFAIPGAGAGVVPSGRRAQDIAAWFFDGLIKGGLTETGEVVGVLVTCDEAEAAPRIRMACQWGRRDPLEGLVQLRQALERLEPDFDAEVHVLSDDKDQLALPLGRIGTGVRGLHLRNTTLEERRIVQASLIFGRDDVHEAAQHDMGS